MSERLTLSGVDGIRVFCSACSDRPMFGKCILFIFAPCAGAGWKGATHEP